MIPYGRQSINQADIDAVVEVLRSDFITQGPVVPRFEQAVARYCGAQHAVATNSATSALHLACLVLGVGPGDCVWTSPITFVASANCARYCGATADFVDIDSRTYNLSPQALEEKLVAAERKGRLPKVVIPVHLAGQPCDLSAIHRLGQRFGFRIIEDASHAIGGRYREEPVGNCRYSDITVFSFHPVKIITTGEGGMALTNDPEIVRRMVRLRSHGITRDPAKLTHEADGPWYYEQLELGFNYRLTDIQAALGLSQLRRLDEFVACRQEIAQSYTSAFADLPVATPYESPETDSAHHLYITRLRRDRASKTHREVFDSLRNKGIGVNLHYIPVYRQPYYASFGFNPKTFPESEGYYAEVMSLPIYPSMTMQQQSCVVDALREAIGVQPSGDNRNITLPLAAD
jgi:UDP-4-amino-4,6-dideoxy-N-acetyl-beta-L-altrosamine transaminase